MLIQFYESCDDAKLKFAVIAAKRDGKYLFCRHRDRATYELPGGHRESGETIDEAARRELIEETGAQEFTLEPICVYSVTGKNAHSTDGEETFGMLFAAEITAASTLTHEIAEIILCDTPPSWTYPQIQPYLLDEYERRKSC